MGLIDQNGFVVFDPDPRTLAWARAAFQVALPVSQNAAMRTQHLRHGGTWFVGVDALPNDTDGALSGVPLEGPWQDHVPQLPLHRAQMSIIYPGYPLQDPGQSAANHAFRVDRKAAHVDGLLPEGTPPRRFAREYHAYILGIPLNHVPYAPTVVWRGSHRIMRTALKEAIGNAIPGDVDVTAAYAAARRHVFETCEEVELRAQPGQAFLIHRFALHGTAPWCGPDDEGRMIVFFRPEYTDPSDWLTVD